MRTPQLLQSVLLSGQTAKAVPTSHRLPAPR